MNFLNKKILLVSGLLFLVFTVQSQKSSSRAIYSFAAEGSKIDTIIDTELVNLKVSVKSNKKGYLENLTSKNFEIYDAKTLQKIEILNFDESTNQYDIGYIPDIPAKDEKRREVRLKIKLSAEEKKEYGKIIVNRQKWILFKPEHK